MKKFHFIPILCAVFCAGALLAGCSDSLVVSSGGGGGGSGSSTSGGSSSSGSVSGGGTPSGSSGGGSVSDSAEGGGTNSSYDNSSYSLSGTTWIEPNSGITLSFYDNNEVCYTEPVAYDTYYSYSYNSYGYNDGSGTAYVADTAVLFSVSGSTLVWDGLTFYQNY
ncbi:MAG: hypothetical protein NC041_08715 [Bacteroides sp.]|nr:hypothetical protein [Prevotella sp.]MCM1408672.1 hypothetical protein [Treponema brennaborense]MCM1470533.1 hypothetical protein [Bacteroides sp.]